MFLQTRASRMPSLNFTTNIYAVTNNFPIRYVNGFHESKVLSLKYPYLQLFIPTSQFYMENWCKLQKSKHCYFLT